MGDITVRAGDVGALQGFAHQFAGLWARGAAPPMAVCLQGPLGAGKTTLARAMIGALGGGDDVPSPTYTLVQTYCGQTGLEIWHADLYRLEHEDEVMELGLDDAFDHALVLVEWPDRLGRWQPGDRVVVDIALVPQTDNPEPARELRVTGFGKGEAIVHALAQHLR